MTAARGRGNLGKRRRPNRLASLDSRKGVPHDLPGRGVVRIRCHPSHPARPAPPPGPVPRPKEPPSMRLRLPPALLAAAAGLAWLAAPARVQEEEPVFKNVSPRQ